MPLDLIIEGATVHDGSGRLPFHADVGILGDRIAEIGDLYALPALRRIDARELVLCPGFIDPHSHADLTIGRMEHVKLLAPLVRQGITTFVGGNCGVGLAPVGELSNHAWRGFLEFFMGESPLQYIHWRGMGEFFSTVERQGALLNFAMLAPHGILRMLAMQGEKTPPTELQMGAMRRELEICLEAGAIGMSSGLQYFPGLYSETSELIELGRTLRRYNGRFTAHLRSYNSDTLPQAVGELIDVGREAEIPVQISHLFWCPNPPWPWKRPLIHAQRLLSYAYRRWPNNLPVDQGPAPILRQIRRAVEAGQPVGVDAMPTSAAFTHLIAFFPPWLVEESQESILERMRDPECRKKLRHAIEHGTTRWPHREGNSWSLNLFKLFGWEMATIMSVRTEKNQRFIGRNFVDIGRELGKHPFDAMCDLFVEEEGRVLVFETTTYPGDPFVERAQQATLMEPFVSIATDTILMGFGRPSHLFHDAFPRFLAGYARDRKVLPLHEAIRKVTSLPASQFGLRDRGLIRKGAKADVVVFDPKTLRSHSTATEPEREPEGIRYVLINGGVVVDPDGLHTERLHGEVIRR